MSDTCDLCRVLRRDDCPGDDAHCAAGQHCTSVVEVCALDKARDDHGRACCHCSAALAQ